MTRPVSPPVANRGPIEYTSISSAVDFDPPIAWILVVSAGSGGLVVKDEGGVSRTYTGLAPSDAPLVGPFSQITSMTLSKIRVGDGAPPMVPVGQAEASAATSLATVDSTNLSTAVSADTSLVSRLSTADSTVLSSTVSADTSLYSRLSTQASTDKSTATSSVTSLNTRVSIAESTEASKG